MQIGPYRIDGELGRGGMGAVYAGFDPALERPVAVKVLRPDADWSPTELERFQRETRALAQLRHPNVVGVHAGGVVHKAPYLVMDRLPGPSLQVYLQRNGLPTPTQAAAWVERLAAAVSYVHQRGLLHRDIKPDNVLLDATQQPVLTDFGLVRVAQAERVSLTGEMLGTPAFMAPEQTGGEREQQGPWTDVYGLGATLFALLTGDPPFGGPSALAVLQKVLTQDAPNASALNRGVPVRLAEVCARCLAKSPQDRYPDAESLRRDLASFLHEDEVPPPPPPPRSVLGAVALASVGWTLALAGWFNPLTPAPKPLRVEAERDPEVEVALREELAGVREALDAREGQLRGLRAYLLEQFCRRLADDRGLDALTDASTLGRLVSGGHDPVFEALERLRAGPSEGLVRPLEQYAEQTPEDAAARLVLGQVRLRLYAFEEALEDFAYVEANAPAQRGMARFMRAVILQSTDAVDEGDALMAELSAEGALGWRPWRHRARSLMERGLEQEGVEVLREGLRRFDQNPELMFELAHVLRLNGQPGQALTVIAGAYEVVNDTYGRSWALTESMLLGERALALKALGRRREAEADLYALKVVDVTGQLGPMFEELYRGGPRGQ